MKDELYVSTKTLEKRNSVIEALNARFAHECTLFEGKMSDALYQKDKVISEMEEQMRLQRVHCDELEKEMEQTSRERLTQERILRDSRAEREQTRKAIELMKTQINDYQS